MKTNNKRTKTEVTTFATLNDGTSYRLWNECLCGCKQVVRNMFAQGHDMKLKSQQLAAAKQ